MVMSSYNPSPFLVYIFMCAFTLVLLELWACLGLACRHKQSSENHPTSMCAMEIVTIKPKGGPLVSKSMHSMNLNNKRLFLLSLVRLKKKMSLTRSLLLLLCFSESDENTPVFIQLWGHSSAVLCQVHRDRDVLMSLYMQGDFSPILLPHLWGTIPISLPSSLPSLFIFISTGSSPVAQHSK